MAIDFIACCATVTHLELQDGSCKNLVTMTFVESQIILLGAAITLTKFCHRAAVQATKGLSALIDKSWSNQDRTVQAGAPNLLCQLASFSGASAADCDAEIPCEHWLPHIPHLHCHTMLTDA